MQASLGEHQNDQSNRMNGHHVRESLWNWHADGETVDAAASVSESDAQEDGIYCLSFLPFLQRPHISNEINIRVSMNVQS